MRDVAAAISPRPRQGGARRRSSTASWSISTYPAQRRRARSGSSPTQTPEALPLYRHSTAHLLAAAVTKLFPGAQCGIGPATDEGFFYDFVVDAAVRARGPRGDREEDEGAGGAGPASTSGRCGRARRRSAFFAKRGEPLKVQLIDEKTEGQPEVSCYTIKDRDTFVDFCVGPHVPSTGRLKAFKLLTTSNAYWKGDAQQPADAARLRHRVLLATRS